MTGFYYIPGTDTCIKIGGYLRVQTESMRAAAASSTARLNQLTQARYNRSDTNDIDYRVRAVLSRRRAQPV